MRDGRLAVRDHEAQIVYPRRERRERQRERLLHRLSAAVEIIDRLEQRHDVDVAAIAPREPGFLQQCGFGCFRRR